jgi:uncharacterized protein YcfJ
VLPSSFHAIFDVPKTPPISFSDSVVGAVVDSVVGSVVGSVAGSVVGSVVDSATGSVVACVGSSAAGTVVSTGDVDSPAWAAGTMKANRIHTAVAVRNNLYFI